MKGLKGNTKRKELSVQLVCELWLDWCVAEVSLVNKVTVTVTVTVTTVTVTVTVTVTWSWDIQRLGQLYWGVDARLRAR